MALVLYLFCALIRHCLYISGKALLPMLSLCCMILCCNITVGSQSSKVASNDECSDASSVAECGCMTIGSS